jgi:hypothetical protein
MSNFASMWVSSIWFVRHLMRHPCVQELCRPLRRAAHPLHLVSARFEALGEFALSSWFEWCWLYLLGWSESPVRRFRQVAGNGAAAWLSSPVTAPPSRPLSCHNRSNQDRRPRIEDTPSWCKFLKESLDFPEIEPFVLNAFRENAFFLGKRKRHWVKSKYVSK